MVRIDEHLSLGKGSVICDHLQWNLQCKEVCNKLPFEIIDQAKSEFQLKIKEAIHIEWEKPILNKQIKHIGLNISV